MPSVGEDHPNWPPPQPLNTYGFTGLLEMPSARMMNDGELAISFATAPQSYRTSIAFQIFPWLEGSFRYSRISDFYDPATSGRTNLLDRSFGLKVRLFDETEYLPAVAVGLLDVIGTGVYGGEYVVASKNIFHDFDVTLGLGWGRLGSVGMFRNPLSVLSDKFDVRPVFDPTTDFGGRPLFGTIFRGRDVSLFGGVVWQTPIDGLQAIVEYSGDKYSTEGGFRTFRPDSQFNFGLDYRPDPLIEASVGWLYGNTFNFHISLHLDPTVETMKVLDPPPLPPTVRPANQRPQTVAARSKASVSPIDLAELHGLQYASADDEWSLSGYARAGNALIDQPAPARGGENSLQDIMTSGQWYNIPAIRNQIIESLKRLSKEQSLGIEAVDLKPNYVTVYYRNSHYTRDTELIHRLLRALTTLPPSVEHFYLTSVVDGYPSTEAMLSRSAYERAVQQFSTTDNLIDYVELGPGGMEIPDDAVRLGPDYPRYDYSIYPRIKTLVFDPNAPFRVRISAVLDGSVEFGDGYKIEGAVSAAILNPVTNDVTRIPSLIPHVRSDFREYLNQGANGIEQLQVSKRGKVAPDIFYEVKAGYLEDMYGGVGGEMVWRPKGSDIAWGANLYYLKQRSFDRLFGFRDYSVVTGQVSMYWQNAIWTGVNLNVHAGRYLAGDYGATVELTRKFDSGVEVGAFATITNVSARDFGEGSFDKGLIIRIPLGWITPFSTRFEGGTYLRSLIRDGGQRLYDQNPLWEDLKDSSEATLRRGWPLDVTPGL